MASGVRGGGEGKVGSKELVYLRRPSRGSWTPGREHLTRRRRELEERSESYSTGTGWSFGRGGGHETSVETVVATPEWGRRWNETTENEKLDPCTDSKRVEFVLLLLSLCSF